MKDKLFTFYKGSLVRLRRWDLTDEWDDKTKLAQNTRGFYQQKEFYFFARLYYKDYVRHGHTVYFVFEDEKKREFPVECQVLTKILEKGWISGRDALHGGPASVTAVWRFKTSSGGSSVEPLFADSIYPEGTEITDINTLEIGVPDEN